MKNVRTKRLVIVKRVKPKYNIKVGLFIKSENDFYFFNFTNSGIQYKN